MTESTKKKIKIHIGGRHEANSDNMQMISPASSSSRFDPAFVSTSSSLPLADLVTSSYLSKRGKDRKNSRTTTQSTQKSAAKNLLQANRRVSAHDDMMRIESGPRVEILDGKIVIKESSLVINGAEQGNNDDYEEIEEGALATSRYSSFTTKKPSRAWGLEETRIFYNALRQCGIDFSMLQSFFPSRTRKELKMKYRREESQHPELVYQALNATLPLDILPFELHLGMKLDTVAENSNNS